MSSTRPPNIVFVVSDQHRRDHAGCYGHPLVRTPAIDQLAAQGVVFDRAYAPSPICGPCRTALMAGQHVHRTGALTHQLMHAHNHPAPPTTLGRVFREAGYATAAFGKVHVSGETDEQDLGFDERALRIYTSTRHHYRHVVGEDMVYEYANYLYPDRPQQNAYNPANKPVNMPEDKMFDPLVADRSCRFIEARQRENQPFFMWVGFEKPHTDYYAPPAYHAMYDPADFEIPEDIWQSHVDFPACIRDNPQFPKVTREAYTDDMLRGCMAAYAAQVTFMDHQLGRVLAALRESGMEDQTIVVYCSDHGDNLFNHGLVHKHCFFEQAVGVPLIVRWPGRIPAGERRNHLVNLIDLFGTFTEGCGIETPPDRDGRSLWPIIDCPDSPAALRDAVFSEYYCGGVAERMIRNDRWKYVHSHGDRHQLYDLHNDPGEHVNLAGRAAYGAIEESLETQVLAGWRIPADYPYP